MCLHNLLTSKYYACLFLLNVFLLKYSWFTDIFLIGIYFPARFYLFILFMAVLGLPFYFCARAFSSCGKRGPLFIAVCGPLTVAASPVTEHRLQTRRLSNCGSRAQLLCGMWDPPRPGLEPVSPALVGRLPTTAPPGKAMHVYLTYTVAVSLIISVKKVSRKKLRLQIKSFRDKRE